MSGILVGVDGSSHSSQALERAAREAAARNVPLAVLAVHQDVVGYTGYGRLLLGSVALQVTRHARCPVVVPGG